MHQIDMNTIYSLSDKNIEQHHRFYLKECWTKERRLQETKKCVNGSQINICILDGDDNLVAYARVLTDFTFKAQFFN